MKLSSKDILLVFGIIIAIVVTLTTIAYSEQNAYVPRLEAPVEKTGVDKTAMDVLKRSLQRVGQYLINIK